jgi:hypothetical protein
MTKGAEEWQAWQRKGIIKDQPLVHIVPVLEQKIYGRLWVLGVLQVCSQQKAPGEWGPSDAAKSGVIHTCAGRKESRGSAASQLEASSVCKARERGEAEKKGGCICACAVHWVEGNLAGPRSYHR